VRKNPFENVLSRLLTIKRTASYWGVSPNSFRKLVQNGIAPGPVHTPGLNRLLFDVSSRIVRSTLSGSNRGSDVPQRAALHAE
jgi:hypothetical protein